MLGGRPVVELFHRLLEPLPDCGPKAALMPGEWVGGLVERCWVDGLVEVGELRRDEKSSLRADVLKLLSCVEDESGRGEDQQPWLRFAGSSGELTRPAASRLRVAHPAVLFLSATPSRATQTALEPARRVRPGCVRANPLLLERLGRRETRLGRDEIDVRLRALSGGEGGGDHQGCRDQRRRRQGRSAPARTRRRTILRIRRLDPWQFLQPKCPLKADTLPAAGRAIGCAARRRAPGHGIDGDGPGQGPPRRGSVLFRPHPR